MKRKIKIIAATTVVTAGLAGAAAGMAVASQESGAEQPITGEALDRASAAALAHTGGGRVTDTEVGDEESLYEVEVTLDDGREMDVQLDEAFTVVAEEAEDATDEADDADDGAGGAPDAD